MKLRPVVIVLAAERGVRFQGLQRKLMQNLGESNVLSTTISNVLATNLPMVVVTTDALADHVNHHVAKRDILVMPAVGSAASRALGMGYSIAAGVASCSDASGWVILPADMPMVQPSTLLAVAKQLSEHPVAYAQHLGRRGHPVGFAAELYTELVMLTGDEGARRLVARYPACEVEVDDPGVLLDLRAEADLSGVRSPLALSPFGHSY